MHPRTYNNLTDEETGYFNAITLAIAHWPIDRKCSPGPTHTHDGVECFYQWVLGICTELHIKEYGE